MKKIFIACLALLNFFAVTHSLAQDIIGPPEYSVLDGNQVNLVTGKRTISNKDLSIGTGVSELSHSLTLYSDYFLNYRDNYVGTIENGYSSTAGTFTVVSFNGISTRFSRNGDIYADSTKSGAKLEKIDDINFIYTHGDGTTIKYQKGIDHFTMSHTGNIPYTFEEYKLAWATEAIYPSGVVIKIHRKVGSWGGMTFYRIQSVTNNLGMQLKYYYPLNAAPSDKWAMLNWARPSEIKAINNSVEYCGLTSDSCSLAKVWPTVKYSWPVAEIDEDEKFVISHADGSETIFIHKLFCSSQTSCTTKTPRIAQVIDSTSPGEITHSYDYKHTYKCIASQGNWNCSTIRPNIVASSFRGNAQWNYTYEIPPYSYVTVRNVSSGPDGTKSVWISPSGQPSRIEDSSKDIKIDLSPAQQVTKVTYELTGYGGATGNSIEFDYDAIGNVVEKREIPKEGSGDPIYISTAGFANNCGSNNVKTQHGASWVKDARGNQVDYTYHCPSGAVATVTLPPDNVGSRHQTRYKYEQKSAVYKNSSGNPVSSSEPVWLLVEESICSSGASTTSGCADPQKEIIKTYEYGNTNLLNNLWLKGVSITSSGETQRTCYMYDSYGNRIAESLPKAGLSSCQ